MDVFVHREPTGCATSDLENVKELDEILSYLATVKPLCDDSEIKIDIICTWEEATVILAQSCFKDIWSKRAKRDRR